MPKLVRPAPLPDQEEVPELRIPNDSAVEILKKLVSVNSVNPDIGGGPGEAEIAAEIEGMLRSWGIDVHTQELPGNRTNVVGVLKGTGGGRSLMLSGHMDTVGVKNMEIDPFKPLIRNGNLYGRGSCDMKGGLAGILAAARAIKESEFGLKGDLFVSGVADEEYVSVGTEKLVEEFKTDGAIVGEPTRMGVGIAHMGYLWIDVETRGRAAHGSVPEKGHDAIADMAEIVHELGQTRSALEKKTHPLLGSPKIHTSTIEGGAAWSLVPDFCHLRVERRTLPGESTADGLREVRRAAKLAAAKHRGVSSSVSLNFARSPFEVDSRDYVSRCVMEACKSVLDRAAFVGVTYWSDASIFLNKGKMETCLFGPGDIKLAHSPLEYVPVKEVQDSAAVYAQTALRFCGIGPTYK